MLQTCIRVFDNQKLVYEDEVAGLAHLGRQMKPGEPYGKSLDNGACRLVIAPVNETVISRRHLQFEPVSPGWLKVTNLSKTQEVACADGQTIEPSGTVNLHLPCTFHLGSKTVCLESAAAGSSELRTISLASFVPRSQSTFSGFLTSARSVPDVQVEEILLWIQATIGVLQSAAHSTEFFQRAARAVVDLAGFDSGRVLLLEQGKWKVYAAEFCDPRSDERDWRPSRQVLARIVEDKKTIWEVPAADNLSESLLNVRSVVAAPILDARGEVLGALYGASDSVRSRPITKLEAMLVEVLASGVATGLARLEQEKEALKARVQFEQFFTPELSRQLFARPDLLEGRDCEVSILFCDLRGFSRITERLGPTKAIDLIRSILSELSECVLLEGGVLVDYIGDELMAMWGAPEPQQNHAERACRAALAMIARLPELNSRFRALLNEPLELSIGVNTGQARVGNVGSTFKFKYGALGNTVNLASRVEGANKFLKTRVLVSQSTQERLGSAFSTRRLGQVRTINIAEPVTLFELVDDPQGTGWLELKRGYEEALDRYATRDFRAATRILGQLLSEHQQDGPSLLLIARAIQCLVDEPQNFDPVWGLPAK